MMPSVFTDEFREAQRRRWSAIPPHGRSEVARIALDDVRAEERDLIEQFVWRLHPDDIAKIVIQLRGQFETTWGELVVAQVLMHAGFRPRYSPKLRLGTRTLTPDWLVEEPEPWICEAFTARATADRTAHETARADIEARLTEIPLPFTVQLQMADAAIFDAKARKHFAAKVKQWLETSPEPGDFLRVDGATIDVAFDARSHVHVISREPIHIVHTPASLARNFEMKAKRYAPVGLPVIAAAVKSPNAEILEIAVEDVLLGEDAYISRETMDGEIIGSCERLHNGVFARRPDLAGVLWINPYRHPAVIRFWSNPVARHPLPGSVIERLTAISS